MAEVALASSFARLSLSLPNSLSSFSGLRIETTKLPASSSISLVKQNRAASTTTTLLPRITANSAVIEEREALEKYVKSVMPGGLAAQKLLATGRRKTAVARVCLVEGTGKIIINYRTAQDYLQGNPLWLQYVKFPLVSLGYETKYDVIVKAEGGGLAGQAQAILLGIARALCVANPANRDPLKKQGLLTRDPRSVERKKAGLHKARKAPQFSKR